jgi:hypothetical protein
MQLPTFAILDEMKEKGKQCRFFGDRMHSNPRFYKYVWWVFWKGSPAEGGEFLALHPMATAEAMKLIERLEHENEPHMVYNDRLPRRGTIFDPTAKKWQNAEWAPAFDEDGDETWNGHK